MSSSDVVIATCGLCSAESAPCVSLVDVFVCEDCRRGACSAPARAPEEIDKVVSYLGEIAGPDGAPAKVLFFARRPAK